MFEMYISVVDLLKSCVCACAGENIKKKDDQGTVSRSGQSGKHPPHSIYSVLSANKYCYLLYS